MMIMMTKLIPILLWIMAGCHAGPQSAEPASPPTPTPASTPAQTPATATNARHADAAIDDLLNRLEPSDADLNAFTAKITYEKQDEILGRKEIRTGELIYRVDETSKGKSFAILFDASIVNGRKRNELKHYIFDGRWLAEIDHQNKQFIKREIVAPGRTLDPLKLGEGPVPLPIGQPKSEVLARFDVAAAEVPGQGILKELKNVHGLLLTPKPGTREAREFKKVELFYDRATLLPLGIIAIETNEDRKTVRLSDVKRNPTLDEAMLQKLNINEPDPREWRVDVRPWVEAE